MVFVVVVLEVVGFVLVLVGLVRGYLGIRSRLAAVTAAIARHRSLEEQEQRDLREMGTDAEQLALLRHNDEIYKQIGLPRSPGGFGGHDEPSAGAEALFVARSIANGAGVDLSVAIAGLLLSTVAGVLGAFS